MFRVGFICCLLFSQSVWAGLIDPTRPPAALQNKVRLQGQKVKLKLQQIISRGEQRFAMIDGRKVEAGQQLGEYRVLSIEPRQVVLEKADRTRVNLTLFKNFKR